MTNGAERERSHPLNHLLQKRAHKGLLEMVLVCRSRRASQFGVLQVVADAFSIAAAPDMLGAAPSTVQGYLRNIRRSVGFD
jgi:hypothetical protein